MSTLDRRAMLKWLIVSQALLVTPLLAATMGANVRQISFDPKTGTAVFEIRNLSSKYITAYSLSYEAVYTDGSKGEHAERMCDFWPGVMNHIVDGDLSPGAGALHPAASAKETLGANPVSRSGSPLQSINVVLDVVVYSDNSAQVANKDAFGRVRDERQARTATISDMNAILQKHLTSRDVEGLEADLNALLAETHKHPSKLDSGEVLTALDNLHRAKDKTDFLIRYADRENKQVAPSNTAAKIEVQDVQP